MIRQPPPLPPLLTVLGALLAAGPVRGADVYFEQTTVSSKAGTPAGPGVVSRVWHSGRRLRLEAGGPTAGSALILNLEDGTAYRLDPVARTATALDLERLRARAQLDAAMAGDVMEAGLEGPARTVPLRSTLVVAGHRCRGWRVKAGATVMDVYLAEDVPVGMESFAELLEWTGASQALGGVLGEIQRLRGFPMETRTRVTVLGEVHETVATVTELRVERQPRELFEPPPQYRRVEEPPDPDSP